MVCGPGAGACAGRVGGGKCELDRQGQGGLGPSHLVFVCGVCQWTVHFAEKSYSHAEEDGPGHLGDSHKLLEADLDEGEGGRGNVGCPESDRRH